MKVAIYARVSTSIQSCDNQIICLRDIAERMKWTIVAELKDEGISGMKGRESRPAWNALHKMIQRKEIDVVLAWSIDRLGRSITDLVAFMKELSVVDIDLYCHQQSINTQTASGRMCFSIFAALGEYERELIRERVLAGLENARRKGRRLGRPTNVRAETKQKACQLRSEGMSIGKIAATLRIGVGTTTRLLKQAS